MDDGIDVDVCLGVDVGVGVDVDDGFIVLVGVEEADWVKIGVVSLDSGVCMITGAVAYEGDGLLRTVGICAVKLVAVGKESDISTGFVGVISGVGV
ncbi:hypothetical protein [Acetivibrio straminisolvens]|uniref:Uncharacterized protein n=1 Tax=Acetivibrio straminisolvens JCM 21531 TaxID=1294263 RepID=W4V945_9FIRM|nr:hypothetical protein [Acetivibrio straminisolvens]GAE89279.1 hypothetical protein JCM21531_2788 [Acetivibrio straminisolvens JCM 21531]